GESQVEPIKEEEEKAAKLAAIIETKTLILQDLIDCEILRIVVEGAVWDRTVGLKTIRGRGPLIVPRILRRFCTKLTIGRLIDGSSCGGIDMVIKDLDLEPKIDAMMRDFLE
ncbi:hypothetical protein Tco_1436568, partial [Tanacetum coccineum]